MPIAVKWIKKPTQRDRHYGRTESYYQHGGTMHLGAYECILDQHSKTFEAYKSEHIQEHHVHRYEFNNDYKQEYEKAGMKCVGTESRIRFSGNN